MSFAGWARVARGLRARAASEDGAGSLVPGQRSALVAIAARLHGRRANPGRGVVLADEVGMGKTRIACAVAAEVRAAGGRVAVLIPPGLGHQWTRELRTFDVAVPGIVRGLSDFLAGLAGPAPWFGHPVLLVSHLFANWWLGESSRTERFGLLPALVALRHAEVHDKVPWGWRRREADIGRSLEAARALLRHLHDTEEHGISGAREAIATLDALGEEETVAALLDGGRYGKHQDLRLLLERAAGLGLGPFDLVVIDEAHKARGEHTGLTRLESQLLRVGPYTAWLGMTATPVGLDAEEWSRTLRRVRVPPNQLDTIDAAAVAYRTATRTLTDSWRSNPEVRRQWREASADFTAALRPWVLRRDKRQDPLVAQFVEWEGRSHREPVPCRIAPGALSLPWRRILLASEALSATVGGQEDPAAKRLRLTLANGHGLAALVDRAQASDEEIREDEGAGDNATDAASSELDHRLQRAELWRGLVVNTLARAGGSLESHPHILEAASHIRAYVDQGHKVLVFGRYTRPMKALVDVLNRLAEAEAEAKGSRREEQRAATARRRWLAEQPKKQSQATPRQLRVLWDLLKHRRKTDPLRQIAAAARKDPDADHAALARALYSLVEPPELRTHLRGRRRDLPPEVRQALLDAFEELVTSGLDLDLEEHREPDLLQQGTEWRHLSEHLTEEFARQESRFARLLHGATRMPTRRLLQASFNRRQSQPTVLVAQSMVGREGLNLHGACRVVFLLHPEWNAGVVEQQIGRVDRIASRWERDYRTHLVARGRRRSGRRKQGVEPPMIEVVSLVFGGTYDEHHWAVLQRRWRDLRAQLHGQVILPSMVPEDDPEAAKLAAELNGDAPAFLP